MSLDNINEGLVTRLLLESNLEDSVGGLTNSSDAGQILINDPAGGDFKVANFEAGEYLKYSMSEHTGAPFTPAQLTLGCWARWDSLQDEYEYIVVADGDGYDESKAFGFTKTRYGDSAASNEVYFGITTNSGDFARKYSNDGVEANRWYHMVGVYNGADIKLYIDGELQTGSSGYDIDVVSEPGAIKDFDLPLYVNNSEVFSPSWPGKLMNGQVNDVCIWERALDALEIAALYSSGQNVEFPALEPIIVKQDGSGDFISIVDAMDSIQGSRDRIIEVQDSETYRNWVQMKSNVTLQAGDGHIPMIQSPLDPLDEAAGNDATPVVYFGGVENAILRGFKVDNYRYQKYGSIIGFADAADNCMIRNCEIFCSLHTPETPGPVTDEASALGIFGGAVVNLSVVNNEIHSVPQGTGNTWNSSGIKIFGNVFRDFYNHQAISIYPSGDMKIVGNTITTDDSGYSWGLMHVYAMSNDAVIMNNIFIGQNSVEFAGSGHSVSKGIYSYNCFVDQDFSESIPYKGSGDPGPGNLYLEDPLFTDPTNNDYSLQSGSPCVDAGADASEYYIQDINKIYLPQLFGWDMGAVELVDTIIPVITVLGEATITFIIGDPSNPGQYIDDGAIATDNIDSSISANIEISGDVVDLSKAGVYIRRYDVRDASGNAAIQQTRTIIVIDASQISRLRLLC